MKSLAAIVIILFSVALLRADAALNRMAPYAVDRAIVADADAEKSHLSDARLSAVAPGRNAVPARTAARGGMIRYQLAADPAEIPQLLHIRYSGDDRPKPGEKYLFRIFVNGKSLALQGLSRNFPNAWVDEFYPIPAAALRPGAKSTLDVEIRPEDAKSSIGGIYAISVLRQKTDTVRLDRLDQWQGLQNRTMPIPGAITYTEPDGPEGWRNWGWLMQSDTVMDLTRHWGLELTFDLQNQDGATLEFIARMNMLPKEDRDTGNISRTVKIELARSGKQTVYLPFADFANPTANISDTLYKVKSIELKVAGKPGKLVFDAIRVLPAYQFAATAPRYSQGVNPGESAVYPITIENTTRERAAYRLDWIKRNWEGMEPVLTPARLVLAPGERAEAKLTVTVPAKIPVGGKEKHRIRITPDGNPGAAKELEFITYARIPAPYTIHDAKGWAAVRDKAARYDWAKKSLKRITDSADAWRVPVPAEYRLSPDTLRPCLITTTEERKLMDAAVAWQVTRDKKYAEKVALFLRRVTDPATGFPKTHQVGQQGEVQEGHVFQHIAQAYDLIGDSGLLTAADRKQIDASLQIFCDMVRRNNSHPAGANWALSSETGALFSALAMGDLAQAEFFVFGPGMITDKLSSYTMPDGWWYECSISYNLWCAEEFTQVALAMERFGYSLLDRKYPVNFSNVPDNPMDDETEYKQRTQVHYGHSFRIFGGIGDRTVTIKKMFDAMIPYIDYRGWIFGINDSTENNVGGGRFELAYHAFRDPFYASFIKRAPERTDLVYGVPELPADTPEIGKGSAYSDNVGLLMLRSTQRDPRERIQAVLKYGTHGGYHGHYDRTGLLSMMRYGRSFFNPEMIWYSYQPFMYNFYVQSSIAKNMVTVDLKQQEVDESARILFGTGDMFQAGAVETESRWSNPGFGGLRWGHVGFPTLSSKSWAEGRYVPIPQPEPRYGSMSGFTEKILQRRLLAVTDDYLVIADFDRGNTVHDFDQLFQIKGLLGVTAPQIKLEKKTPQLTADPFNSAQFITDCNWYRVTGTAKASFLTRFGKNADNRGTRMYGEDGDLFVNIYYAWPNAERTLFTGLAPEAHGVARKLFYSVRGDGKVLADGKFGAWLLGDAVIDVPLDGVKILELSAAVESRGKVHTLFWADAVIETADGKTVPLTALPPVLVENTVKNPNAPSRDYEGGKINIAGRDYATGLPADPDKTGEDRPSRYRFDLTGLNAKRLKTVIGGDYPVGNEAERRITVGVREKGAQAHFLTVMEPYEKTGRIASVEADSAESLTVKRTDGKIQRFQIRGMATGTPEITMTETDAAGKVLRTETVSQKQ